MILLKAFYCFGDNVTDVVHVDLFSTFFCANPDLVKFQLEGEAYFSSMFVDHTREWIRW